MTLLVTKKCTNYGICEPECPNEAISMGEHIYEISGGKCAKCVRHYETPTRQKVCPISSTITKDPQHARTGEQLQDEFVLARHTDKV